MNRDSNNKIVLLRIRGDNKDFTGLVDLLDEVLRESDGDDHTFFAQFNKLDGESKVVVAYMNNIPAGCGAIKKYSEGIAEIKRMFVKPEFRGRGLGKNILKELELWAKELKYSECVLETGKKMEDAVRLYRKFRIRNY